MRAVRVIVFFSENLCLCSVTQKLVGVNVGRRQVKNKDSTGKFGFILWLIEI